MDKKLNNQIQNSIKKRRSYISGTMVSDPNFDIKNYLTDVQKQVELEKIIVNDIKSLPHVYSTINNNQREKKTLLTLNNLLTLSKDNIFNNNNTDKKSQKIVNTDLFIGNKFYEVNDNIQLTKKQITKMLKNFKKNSKSSSSIFRKKKLLSNDPTFNVIKSIKNFKKKDKKSFSQRNIIKKDKKESLKKQFKTLGDNNNNNIDVNKQIKNNYYNNILAFTRKHENLVYEPIKIINEYNRQKGLGITYQEKCLSNFKTQNKELSINNVLIKLMNSETNKLSRNYYLLNENLNIDKKEMEKNEVKFEDYKISHRKACKRLDNIYINIQKKNKELIEKNRNCKREIKIIHEDMRRELHQIDNLRSYGYFINNTLGGDTTRFEMKIFPDEIYENDLDIEILTKNVIKKYMHFFDETEEEKLVKEKNFINEPEKLWLKFKEIQGIIVRNMYIKESIKDEIKKIKEENNYNLKDLLQKHEILIKEKKIINEEYKYELSKYNEVEKIYNYQKSEYDDLIIKFYLFIKNIFNDNKKILYDNLDVSDCVKEIHDIICDKEIIIDKLITDLKRYEKKDYKIIEKVAYNRKKENYYMNKSNEKHSKRIGFANYNDDSKIKYIIHYRKTEAPYHRPIKVIKEKVDEKLVEQVENEELINYEE